MMRLARSKNSAWANKIKRLMWNKNPNIIINLNHKLRQFFGLPYMDKTNDEADYEHPNTTDMPDLKREESDEQRRNQKEQGLTILTPDQMLSQLLISLVQLKAGNNPEKIKIERR